MQKARLKSLMMKGSVSIEKTEDGLTTIILKTMRKEEVNELVFRMIELGFDISHEPRSRMGAYESCAICGEKLYVKIIANE